jgi:hypothetical protein
MNNQPRRSLVVAGVCLLLFIFGLQIASTVHQESLTWDEGDHILPHRKWNARRLLYQLR